MWQCSVQFIETILEIIDCGNFYMFLARIDLVDEVDGFLCVFGELVLDLDKGLVGEVDLFLDTRQLFEKILRKRGLTMR